MGFEQAKQAGALWQAREQRVIVASQPAIERPITDPFQGVQQTQRDNFTGPQHRLGMLAFGPQGVVYPAKQLNDKVKGGHVGWPPAQDGGDEPQGFGAPTWPLIFISRLAFN
jgi:hypothetical protein